MQLELLCHALCTEFYELFSFETRMLTYANVCWRMQLEPLCDALRTEFYELLPFKTKVQQLLTNLLTYADVC